MKTGLVRNKIEAKAYGFIIADGKEYFFHKSQCITPFEDLFPGNNVQFEIEPTPKGNRAFNVEKC